MKILIATKNPGKIEGARKAFSNYYEQIEIKGIPVSSKVPEQAFIMALTQFINQDNWR